MSTREQFGDYLLLKKLTEDPLGETFRAGKLGAKGMERVALLRVFNGQGLDGQRLWAGAQERSGIQQLLRGPNLGEGIEMGEIQGIPYVAYDYISGKNLATLLQQVTRKRSAIPTEHGLLITERVALGLALAAENRHDGKRIHHGFVIPHLVMISNEGESRLLGFEVGPGLRAFAANPVGRRHFGRYLAPEALAGAPLDSADDIYSLGVILLELLTGKPLPAPSSGGYGPIIEQARLADEGAEIPAPLKQLLRASLVPKEQRLQDVAAWHKTLNQWMFEGKYNPTTFNLAFFMHNLFRQDIERESEEIEVEKTLPLPVATATPASLGRSEETAAPTPTPIPPSAPEAPVTMPIEVDPAAGAEAAGAPASPTPPAAATERDASAGGRKGLMIALAAILLLAAGAGVWWWLDRSGRGPIAGAAAATTTPTATPPGPVGGSGAATSGRGLETADAALLETGSLRVESADDATVTEEAEAQLQAQIDSLVEQKASAMESQLREQMDSQLEALRNQLERAQAEATAREKELLAQQAKADEEARAKAAEEEKLRLAEEERLRLEAEAAAAAAAEQERLAEEEAARLAEEEAAAAAAPPPPPAVRRGDLVEPGPGIGVPKLVRIPPARFPEMARRLNKSDVEVVVRVLVDENGDVLEARLPNKKVGFGFDTEALKVARKATYEPARAGNVPVKMWAVVRVKFQG